MNETNTLPTTETKATEDEKKIWLKRIRNFVGILGMLLPWISLLGAFIVSKAKPGFIPQGFWDTLSISATYYVTPPLTGILTAASIVLICYKGYKWYDNLITTLSGVCGALIVIFPCNCPVAENIVGFFQLPVNTSHIIHCASAILFFTLLAVNSMFLFTVTDKTKPMTRNKKIKNIIFRVCAVGMILSLALLPLPIQFPAKIFTLEAVALTFFGVSWLVKGEIFGLLSDD
ncbi:MAG: hypothetical protein IK012_06775 [Fibrobacter sp.]|uniref:hypothetical protein n=1 Tax=Fibrobacter sp. TaxID=35828 RepID=UPI0025B88FF6|nr:hypothetical protein [Fibrobacter sp.]MBR4784943.1 hypothetical protein [Fibrobacter sp.]